MSREVSVRRSKTWPSSLHCHCPEIAGFPRQPRGKPTRRLGHARAVCTKSPRSARETARAAPASWMHASWSVPQQVCGRTVLSGTVGLLSQKFSEWGRPRKAEPPDSVPELREEMLGVLRGNMTEDPSRRRRASASAAAAHQARLGGWNRGSQRSSLQRTRNTHGLGVCLSIPVRLTPSSTPSPASEMAPRLAGCRPFCPGQG